MSTFTEAVVIGPRCLPGTLALPAQAAGLVIFAHGSGSTRASPRNVAVATRLNQAGFATLLFDLLPDAESHDRCKVFDIPLLKQHLIEAIEWARSHPRLARLPIGLFGASTGAAAALAAAADVPDYIGAIVSRGGRPDLAETALRDVKAATMLIVGGEDQLVLDLNRAAQKRMGCSTSLVVIPDATHLFEEPGALESVIAAALGWFDSHLRMESA